MESAASCITRREPQPRFVDALAVCRKLAELELAFLDSPNELDPCNRGRRIVEQLKPKHRAGARLETPMVLLPDVVEILPGAHPGTAPSRMFAPKQPQDAMRCPICIKGDDSRRPIVAKRLAKELLRGLDVAMLAQAKVDRPTVLVHSAVQVNPLTSDFDLGFVRLHSTASSSLTRSGSAS